jgi:hypothetical protein
MKTQELARPATPSLAPLSADRALDTFFLEARSKLLDIAAILDRIQRGEAAVELDSDPRLDKIRQALRILLEGGSASAERIQQVFSLNYDPTWKRPQPRNA